MLRAELCLMPLCEIVGVYQVPPFYFKDNVEVWELCLIVCCHTGVGSWRGRWRELWSGTLLWHFATLLWHFAKPCLNLQIFRLSLRRILAMSQGSAKLPLTLWKTSSPWSNLLWGSSSLLSILKHRSWSISEKKEFRHRILVLTDHYCNTFGSNTRKSIQRVFEILYCHPYSYCLSNITY